MARRFGAAVRLRRFVPDLAGYTRVKDGAGVQAVLAGKAAAVEAAANGMSDGTHETLHRRGKFDMGYVVAAADFESRLDQARHKTLTKALGAAGGGG